MEFCLGTVQFGMDYGVQGHHRQPRRAVNDIIEYAIESGITHFDSAAAYGEAEDILGQFIKNRHDKTSQIKVVSKLEAGVFEDASKTMWADIALKHARGSIAALGVSKLNAFLFHNAKHVFDRIAVESLYEVKREGLADRIGVSVYNPNEALKALEYEMIEVIQIPYNLFDQRLDAVHFFDESRKRNVEIYARSIMLQGLITMDTNKIPEKMSFARKYVLSLDKICNRYGFSRLQTAIGYINSLENVDYIVFGVDTLEQLKEFVLMRDIILPKSMMEDIMDAFSATDERLVNPTRW